MRWAYVSITAFALAAALAACAGGGGTGAPLLSDGSTNPPQMQGGSTTVLTYNQMATSNGPVAGFTCQSPQIGGAATESANASIKETFAANQQFGGRSGLTAVTTVTQLQNCADGSEPVDEVDYFAPPALVGASITFLPRFQSPFTDTLAYASGISFSENAPFQSGRTWNSSPARIFTTAAESLQVDAGGSYTDTIAGTNIQTFPYYSLTTVENADASGSQTLAAGLTPSPPPYVTTLSAPANHVVIVGTSGTPPIPPDWPTPTACPTAGGTPCPVAPSPTPHPQYAWYPYVPSAQSPFETIASTDKGSAPLPSACVAGSAFPKSAELIETVDAALDIWTGTARAVSDAYVDPRYGVLCAQVTVTQASYTFAATSADTTPTGTTTLTFVDSLQTESAAPGVAAIPAPGRYLIFWR